MADEDGERDEELDEKLDRWLRPLVAESLLWPVTLSVGAVFALFVATVLVAAARERSLFAAAAVLGLAWLSVEPLQAAWRRRRIGPTAGIVIGLWLGSVALAVLGARTGLL